jgi:hypothetical protein
MLVPCLWGAHRSTSHPGVIISSSSPPHMINTWGTLHFLF